jgi:hypothetical protein
MPTVLTVALTDLLFDPHNPRLVGDFGHDQSKMFRYLISEVGVDDLLESISTSGLFDADPIIVSPAKQSGKFYVIEGNRRLAALMLLSGETPNDKQPIPKIPPISAGASETFNTIKVQTDWTPEALQAYLGYKHVTASREWAPESKAKFVFEHANGDLSIENLRKFARTLGTKYPVLKRWLVAYLVLKQGQELGIFDPELAPSKGYFGTFYTLLGGKQTQKYLDIGGDVKENPVPEDNHEKLGEILLWTVGTQEKDAVVNSRQQGQFEEVLASPRALAHFKLKGDLDSSLLYTEYNAEEIAVKFRRAAISIEDTLPKLNDVKDSPQVQDSFQELEGAQRKARINMGFPALVPETK